MWCYFSANSARVISEYGMDLETTAPPYAYYCCEHTVAPNDIISSICQQHILEVSALSFYMGTHGKYNKKLPQARFYLLDKNEKFICNRESISKISLQICLLTLVCNCKLKIKIRQL